MGFEATDFSSALNAEEGEVRVLVDMDAMDETVPVPAEGKTVKDILNEVGFQDVMESVNSEMLEKDKEIKEIALYSRHGDEDVVKINDNLEDAMDTVLKGGTVLEVRFKIGANY